MPVTETADATEIAREDETGSRVGVFDLVRGFSVVSMVLFHLCYDLKFIVGLPLDWFAPPLQDVWRCSISWTFLFVAGCMCPLSRSNLRRALQYGAVALAIWIVTTIAAVDIPISFGIIYCMAACTFVAWALGRLHALPHGVAAALALLAVFLLTQGLSDGYLGVDGLRLELPAALYASPWLSWLGMPGPNFSSGDYYPLLPYLFVYLAGAAMGSRWAESGYPGWAKSACLVPLNLVGRHALLVYILHQPIILGVSMLLGGL